MNIGTPVTAQEPTLADLIAALARSQHLGETRRRDLVSAVTTAARLLNRRPEEIPAKLPELRERLSRIHPAQANMTRKRLDNVKSGLKAAWRHLPAGSKIVIRDVGFSASWKTFRERLETDWQRHALSRLGRYCSARRIPPERVSDAVMERFRAHLETTELAKSPEKVVKITIQTWNGFVERTGAALPVLTKPASKRFITRPLTEYPGSFQADVDAWIKRQSSECLWSEDGPGQPLRPATLSNIRASIRQFAHALVQSGFSIEDITDLSTLVEPTNFKAGLEHLIQRNSGTYPVGLPGLVARLLAIARYHVKAPPGQIDEIRSVKRKIEQRLRRAGKAGRAGLTEKNKARLAQFDDERNVDRLVLLPTHLLKRARGSKRRSSRVALLVMYAVAIELLLACPIREGNLAALNIETHFRRNGQGRGQRLSIVIPGSEVKNDQPVEIDLSAASKHLVDTYLNDWRPLVSDAPGDWLFPARSGGGRRRHGHLGQEMSKLIYRTTGLKMNAHLFRHLAGKLYLDLSPAEYETIRGLLGHRKLTTTTSFYAPLESKRAVARYDEAVLAPRRRK